MKVKINFRRFTGISLLLAAVFFVGACAEDSETLDLRENWVGIWTCSEVQGDFAPQTYQVEIIEKIGPTYVAIKGLYNQGQGFNLEADVDGYFIEIPKQTVNGIEISGSGDLDSKGDLITLFFNANDGSGDDAVKAILRR